VLEVGAVSRYVVNRLLFMVFVLLGVSILVFLLIHIMPGDPATVMLGPRAADADLVARMRTAYGLDQPLPVQYWKWLTKALRGDFGFSIATTGTSGIRGRPVGVALAVALRATFPLTFLGTLIAAIIGMATGIIAAVRRNSAADYIVSFIGFLGISIPDFYLGLLLILLLSVQFKLFPVVGYVDIFTNPVRGLWSLVLPALTIGLINAAAISRMVRSNLLEVLRSEYITVARAKGLLEVIVILRHAMKNAFIPTITVIGLQLGYLLGGVVIIEQVFSIPGMGKLLLTAVSTRDYPVVQACVMVFALLFAFMNLLIDLTYPLLDPRVRL
jgi:peptide/nickel transport system permease protein